MDDEDDRGLDTLAEVISLSQAIAQLYYLIGRASGDHSAFLSAQTEKGLRTIVDIPLHGLSDQQRVRVIEVACMKFGELIAAAGPRPSDG